MTDAVTICSNALGMLGDKGFSSFDETTPRVQRCKTLYPQVRDYVLRSHPWNCATKRVILDPSTTTPAFDWRYSFNLPGDWLRTLSVGDKRNPHGYEQEGRRILSNAATLKLRYVASVPETQWDALLVHAASMCMRATLAYNVTTSASLEQLLQSELAIILQQARAVDGQENPPETLGDELLYQAGF